MRLHAVFRFAPRQIVELSVEIKRGTISGSCAARIAFDKGLVRFMRNQRLPSFGSNEVENCFTNCICQQEDLITKYLWYRFDTQSRRTSEQILPRLFGNYFVSEATPEY